MGRRARDRGGRNALLTVALIAILGLLLGACSPGAPSSTAGATRAKSAKQATKDLAAAENTDLGCAHIVTSEGKRATPAPEDFVLLTDAYAVAEPCWDRVTFTFEPTGADMPPGYEVEYKDGPFTEGPNNNSVFVLGDAALYITFTPASETDTRTPGRAKQTYPGNLSLRLEDMHHTQMVRKLIDGDGNQSWIIGLDEKRPFTVDAANNPPRVSIYIMK